MAYLKTKMFFHPLTLGPVIQQVIQHTDPPFRQCLARVSRGFYRVFRSHFRGCARHNCLALQRWCGMNGLMHTAERIVLQGCRPDDAMCMEAARYGQYTFIVWCVQRDLISPASVDTLGVYAARGGQLETLMNLYIHYAVPLTAATMAAAAAAGSFPTVTWLRHMNCPWDELACTSCAYAPCPEDGVKVLRYLLDNGCPAHYSLLNTAIEQNRPELVMLACTHMSPNTGSAWMAAWVGNVAILKFLVKTCGVTPPENALTIAAIGDNLSAAKWLLAEGYMPNEEAMAASQQSEAMTRLFRLARESKQ